MGYTPGPWWVEVSDDGEQREVCDGFGHTATVYGESATADANARLIAAAPELLAALKGVAAAHTCIESCDMPEWLDAVEAVIAKAEGRSEW